MIPEVYVIIPVYNGQSYIRDNITSILAYLNSRSWMYQLIVINDGSIDGTAREIESIGSKNLLFLDSKINRGKGYAVKKGMMAASGR